MEEYWVLYNASEQSFSSSADWVSEVAVTKEAEAVHAHLETLGLSCRVYPLSDVRTFLRELPPGVPLIFNLCEGFRGDPRKEMHVAALLELLKVPFTGNTAKTLCVAQDKDLTKRILKTHGIPTPRWQLFTGGDLPPLTDMAFPLIVKPSQEDASIGIRKKNVVRDRESLREIASSLYQTYCQPVLIEEFLPGREFSVSVLQIGKEVRVLPVSEISLEGMSDENALVSYEAKWVEESAEYRLTPSICPASIPADLTATLRSLAIETWRALGGKDYGRIDLRLDREGRPFVLEFNPNPDVSLEAGFPKALAASGISYGEFLSILIQNNRPVKEHHP